MAAGGEGAELAPRPASDFYEEVHHQVAPYTTARVFGTSSYAVTWLGIPVQQCGIAWANAVRELDRARPVPRLIAVADGVFRSGASQQCDKALAPVHVPTVGS